METYDDLNNKRIELDVQYLQWSNKLKKFDKEYQEKFPHDADTEEGLRYNEKYMEKLEKLSGEKEMLDCQWEKLREKQRNLL